MKRQIFDENFPAPAVKTIQQKVASAAQVGDDRREKGWLDTEQILSHLHGSKATSHTLEAGFFKRQYIHFQSVVRIEMMRARVIEAS